MPRQTLAEYLDYFSEHKKDIATVHRRGYRTERWTYGRIAETAAQFARELEARGIQRGERVLLWGDNCAEWVAAFWGCLLRGAVSVPIDRGSPPEFAAAIAAQVQAKLCVRSEELSLPAAAGAEAVPEMVLERLAESLRGRSGEGVSQAGVSRKDMAQIIFTSGATAEPKGVVLTHGNLLANLEPLEREILKYRRYERLVHPLRFLELLPLSHVFGQFLGMLVPPLMGATVIFQETLNPSEVMKTIRRERASVLVAVPRMLDSLKGKLERDVASEGRRGWFERQFEAAEQEKFWKRWWRFRRLRRRFGWKFWALVSGGATLNQQTETFWVRLGYAVIQGYGLTETASLVSLNHPFRPSKGSIGKQLVGREVKLDENGEILVRGENIASAYWQGRELAPVAGEEGWFRTGDLGALDAQGNLYFKGRKKNVIVGGSGLNIYPEDLESELRRQPEVRDVVVIGVSRDGNEEPCAVLLLGGEGKEAWAVVRKANERLAEFQRMRSWYVWPEEDFPRTSTQKPKLAVIRETVERELGVRATEEGPKRETASPVAELIERVTGRRAEAADGDLEQDLNLSSLERVELLSALEDRFQREVNEAQFSNARTVAELEKLLREGPSAAVEYPYPKWALGRAVAAVRAFVYYLLVRPATLMLSWPRVQGRENLRNLRGPALFVPNHVTEIDIGFVLAGLPLRYRHSVAVAMVGERLRDLRHPPASLPWYRRLVDPIGYLLVSALFNVFPMPKASGVRGSFQYAGEAVDRGYSLVVFPEGQLTRDGRVGEFRAGIGVLAKRLNIPAVPIKIEGLYELRAAGRRFSRPGTVRVAIGEPARFEAQAEPEEIAQRLRAMVEHSGDATQRAE